MGRIIAQVKVSSYESGKSKEFSALVDTGATYLTLPKAWEADLAPFGGKRIGRACLADNQIVESEIAGPVGITIDMFPETYGEVLFMDMQPVNGEYEILLGHMPLQGACIAVDMLGHRLLAAKGYDVK